MEKGSEIKVRIICFGDSLTFGSVGHSYIKYLCMPSGIQIKNKGVNGDTTVCMFERLKRYIKSSGGTNREEIYIISIGTNDLFLPYLTSVSSMWKIQITPRVKMMRCLTDDRLFEQKYIEIIETAQHNGKKMIAIGLPYLEMDRFPNEKIDERNEIIKRLAKQFCVPYVDVTAIQNEWNTETKSVNSWKHKNLLRVIEGLILPVLPRMKDWLSRNRHLRYTVDGVHWNSALAKAVSEKIQAEIKTLDM